MLCSKCGIGEAEYGYTKCWHCLQVRREHNELLRRQQAVEKEKAERKKPKETIDDIACKARKLGMSYGKYLAARSEGRIKDE